MHELYVLVFLILLVLALLFYTTCESQKRTALGAGEKRSVLIFSSGETSGMKRLRAALAKVQTHEPVYNPVDLSGYSNVPVIWTDSINVGSFQRAHPGVCGGVILWYPDKPPIDTIPESTFVVQDLGKKSADTIWEPHSHHRYYIPKSGTGKHLQEILAAIR